MKQRWLVAIIGLPLLLAVLLLCPQWATMLLVCAIAAVAAYELLHVAGKNIGTSVYAVTILCAAAQVWAIYNVREWYGVEVPLRSGVPIDKCLIIPWILVMFLFCQAVFRYGKGNDLPFTDVATGIVAGAVFPTMYACIALLRCVPEYGKLYVLAPFFIAFAGDSLSMGFGMWFGKRKMAPHVSPHKTWAGGIGGPIGSALGMVLLGFIGSHWLGYTPDYFKLISVGVMANIFGQLGDLSMSLIKREAGIKDYSHIFLTHGGMLDRFDSTLFIAPIVYLCVGAGTI